MSKFSVKNTNSIIKGNKQDLLILSTIMSFKYSEKYKDKE